MTSHDADERPRLSACSHFRIAELQREPGTRELPPAPGKRTSRRSTLARTVNGWRLAETGSGGDTLVAIEHAIRFEDGDLWEVVVETSGEADMAGFRTYLMELVESPQFRPGMNILIDHAQLDADRLTDADADVIADLVIGLDEHIGAGHAACVVPSPHKYRVAELVMDRIEGRVLARTRCFYSREEADGWLALQERQPA